jgi:hypothetical protein
MDMDMVLADPEARFGIELHSRPGPRTLDQMYSLN